MIPKKQSELRIIISFRKKKIRNLKTVDDEKETRNVVQQLKVFSKKPRGNRDTTKDVTGPPQRWNCRKCGTSVTGPSPPTVTSW